MGKTIYAVWCSSGLYDDWSEWVDSIWLTKSEAEKRRDEYNIKILGKTYYPIRQNAVVLEFAIGKINENEKPEEV